MRSSVLAILRKFLSASPALRYSLLFGGFLAGGLAAGFVLASHTGSRATLPLAAATAGVTAQATTAPAAVPSPTSGAAAPPAVAAAPVMATVDATPAASKPSPYAPSRLIIPSLGINSGWMPLGRLPNGITMDTPPGPEDLGWYTFTGEPGGPSNAVFAGHVDWHTGARALFEHLADLRTGAEIDVSRADGTLVTYQVVSSEWYDFMAPAAPIIAPSSVPTVTLITCGGTFDETSHEYDKRLVVRAVAGSS